MRPDTLAIIVTWNKRDVLDRMLASLRASSPPGAFDALVVDNASTDDTVAMLRERHPWVEVLEQPENLGGTGGFNAGMRVGLERGYPYLWLMDNDILVHEGVYEALRATLDADRRIALVGSNVLFMEYPDQTQELGARVDWRTGALVPLDRGEIIEGARLNDAEYVPACSCLARAAAAREVGIWDPAYFIGGDDVDWGVRLVRAGWRVVATAEARVEHPSYFARRPRQGGLTLYIWMRNMLYLFRRLARMPGRLPLLYNYLRIYIGDALTFGAAGKGEMARPIALGILDFFRWRMGTCRHSFPKAAASAPRGFPTIARRPARLLLIGAIDRATVLEQIGRLRAEYPESTVDVFIDEGREELLSAEIPNARRVPFATFGARLRYLLRVWGRYDAVFAVDSVRAHLFERVLPWSCRLDADGGVALATRGGLGALAVNGAMRLFAMAVAVPVALLASVWPMPQARYFTFDARFDRAARRGGTAPGNGEPHAPAAGDDAPRIVAAPEPTPYSYHRPGVRTFVMAVVNYTILFTTIVVISPFFYIASRLASSPRRADAPTDVAGK